MCDQILRKIKDYDFDQVFNAFRFSEIDKVEENPVDSFEDVIAII